MTFRLFPPQGSGLKRALTEAIGTDVASVLDVGCGDRAALVARVPDVPAAVGVDMVLPPADVQPRHASYVRLDVRSLGATIRPRSFDLVVAIDVIEHLTRPEGFALLDAMEAIARKRVAVFTPNGFLPQPPSDGNPHQEHISGWSVRDLRDRGYEVSGVNGLRPLRGAYADIRWRPSALWWHLSALSEHLTDHVPQLSFQLFGVKDVDGRG